MNLLFDEVIQRDSGNNISLLFSLKNNKSPNYIGSNINVIYIYSLEEGTISYPKKEGKIIYIGEARRSDSTGIRFSQHISSNQFTGANSNVNYSLNTYYWGGHKIRLRIFDIGDVTDLARKDYEKYLIKSHVKNYGSTPMAQGTSGYKITETNSLDTSVVEEYLEI